jgi:hypothetical protein
MVEEPASANGLDDVSSPDGTETVQTDRWRCATHVARRQDTLEKRTTNRERALNPLSPRQLR